MCWAQPQHSHTVRGAQFHGLQFKSRRPGSTHREVTYLKLCSLTICVCAVWHVQRTRRLLAYADKRLMPRGEHSVRGTKFHRLPGSCNESESEWACVGHDFEMMHGVKQGEPVQTFFGVLMKMMKGICPGVGVSLGGWRVTCRVFVCCLL